MSFLRRVLARAQGRVGLEGAPRYAFRREVDVVTVPEPEGPVPVHGGPGQPSSVARPPASVRTDLPPRAPKPPRLPTAGSHTERVERQLHGEVGLVDREPHTTIVNVAAPAVPPSRAPVVSPTDVAERRRDVEHHHHHHERTTRELRETHHEVTERVVVRTTAPQAALSPLRRQVPEAPRVARAAAAAPPATPPPVHVSIGRIVLSAAPAPTKPERPRPAVTPARSLADILAAKKGRP